jgi:hypothetical protein
MLDADTDPTVRRVVDTGRALRDGIEGLRHRDVAGAENREAKAKNAGLAGRMRILEIDVRQRGRLAEGQNRGQRDGAKQS